LSFVPDVEQRLWRTVMRRKYQITRNRVQLHSRLEALLEEAHIKVSSVVSDWLGISARRMLQALADGESDSAALATLAAPRLRATREQLCDAFQVRSCSGDRRDHHRRPTKNRDRRSALKRRKCERAR
jgi:transposase